VSSSKMDANAANNSGCCVSTPRTGVARAYGRRTLEEPAFARAFDDESDDAHLDAML
jgi:hypothetical protein